MTKKKREMGGHYYQFYTNKKYYESVASNRMPTTEQLRWNEQIPRNTQSPKTESWINRKSE